MALASGIFALEGDPELDLTRRYSMRPVLQFLKDLNAIDFIFRDIGTPEELQHYLTRWTLAKHHKYNIGYISFHGTPGAISFPDSRKPAVTLEMLGEWLEGRLEGRLIHFCACSVMRLGDARLQRFVKQTRTTAVMGYRTDIDWAESMAFDSLLFNALTRYTRLSDAVNYLDRIAGTLKQHLGFHVIR
ncbi:MAG: hypothetical protein OXB92_01520 [Acidimicrobiaceae bacterium]|nr:hypothetical protein [Acidimicrobiia bacterium]MCY4492519.1 hypothetical protein [Acidimicrobiaceae bacterium]